VSHTNDGTHANKMYKVVSHMDAMPVLVGTHVFYNE
jgi:hypothetical protein